MTKSYLTEADRYRLDTIKDPRFSPEVGELIDEISEREFLTREGEAAMAEEVRGLLDSRVDCTCGSGIERFRCGGGTYCG